MDNTNTKRIAYETYASDYTADLRVYPTDGVSSYYTVYGCSINERG